MNDKKIAFACLDCRLINVIPDQKPDGNKCASCGGNLYPLGFAIVYGVDWGNGQDLSVCPPSNKSTF